MKLLGSTNSNVTKYKNWECALFRNYWNVISPL